VREPRGRFDPGALVTGLFFLVVAGIFVASGLSKEMVVDTRILAPVLLVGLGLVGVVRVLTRARRR